MEIGFVTVFAGDSQRLVADHRFGIPDLRRMTFSACDPGMGPAQSKSGARAVIKRTALPGLRVMAWFTARCSPPDELAEVRILMTRCACGSDTRIAHGICFLVTFRTLHGAVLSFERERGFAVVEEK